jgi:hypothetical protein
MENNQKEMKHPGREEGSNEGCNSSPTWHDFTYNSITPQK